MSLQNRKGTAHPLGRWSKGVRCLLLSYFDYITVKYYGFDWSAARVSSGEIVASGICGENIIWTLTADGTLTITGEGEMRGYSSTSMPWYGYIRSIFHVSIEGDITCVGKYAFADASNLLTVTLPEGITAIGEYAFFGAENLETVALPSTLKSIGRMAFAKCPLKNVTFGNTEGWTAGGTIILSSDLMNSEIAAECVALNVSVEWKVEDETAGE